MTTLQFLAAWSVLSVPAALAVGAVLGAVSRRTTVAAEVVPVPARSGRNAA